MRSESKRGNGIAAPRLWMVIARSHHALNQLAEHSIRNLGLCLSDFAALEALLHKGPLTISEIQAKVLLASGSMTAAIDRLEQRGLVVRKLSVKDRRARVIELTREGTEMAKSSFDRHAQDLEQIGAALPEKDKRQVYESLRKLGLLATEMLSKKKLGSENTGFGKRKQGASR